MLAPQKIFGLIQQDIINKPNKETREKRNTSRL